MPSVLLYFMYSLNIIFFIFVLFFENNNPKTRTAWLLIFVLLPGIGVFFYILLSGHFFTSNKKMLKASKQSEKILMDYFADNNKYLNGNICNNPDIAGDYKQLIIHNAFYGKAPLTVNNSFEIFTSGKDKFKSLFNEIENAKKSIYLEYFIFRKDKTGRELLRLLEKKAREGITVRLLFDDMGSILTPLSFFLPLIKAGGKVSSFAPVRFGIIARINYRNHRKIAVIDDKTAYTGGINIGDEYANISDKNPEINWRDTSVKITGDAVFFLQKQFLIDWFSCQIRKNGSIEQELKELLSGSDTRGKAGEDNIALQVVSSGPDDTENDEIEDSLIRLIFSAKKTLYIQSPYLTPDEKFFSAIKNAVNSGVDVRIMVPEKFDKWYVACAAYTNIPKFLKIGVKVYRYKDFIHSKTFVADSEAGSIGSTNIDSRSFSLHYETNVFFFNKEAGKLCTEIFMKDIESCEEDYLEWYTKKGVFIKALWGFASLFSPIM